MTHSYKGKKFLPILILTLCFVLILGSVFTATAFAEEYAPIGERNKFNVAHITDLHYFAYDFAPVVYEEGSSYDNLLKGSFKLLGETGTMLNAACEKIHDEAIKNDLNAVIVTGDLTKDGEKRSHIDIANRLRALQNEIRADKTKPNPNFQIFVVLGNHDTYNSNGRQYLEGGDCIEAERTTYEEYFEIYSGLGYPNFTQKQLDKHNEESDEFNTPYSKFVNSRLSTAFTYKYFVDDIADYCADYALDKYHLGTVTGTLADKEQALQKEPKAYQMYTNLKMQNRATYIAMPNAEYQSLQGFDIAMIDSTVRVPDKNGKNGYEHKTGGRIQDTTFNWLKDNLVFGENNVPLVEREDTIISALHHGTIPHLSMQESLMNDFLVYDWEESVVKLTDLGINFSLTGHVHATNTDTYIADNGKEMTDIVTGSLASYGSPINYINFERSNAGTYIKNTVSHKTQVINSFDNIPMNLTNRIQIKDDEKFGKWFNDDTTDGVATNYINNVQNYLSKDVEDTILPNLLVGYVNDELIDSLLAKLDSKNNLVIFAKELLSQLVHMQPTYLNKEYTGAVKGEESLLDYLYTLVHDFIGYNETEENDYLATCYIPNLRKQTDPEKDYFKLGDVFVEVYINYLLDAEKKDINESDLLYSVDKLKGRYIDENNNVHFGMLAKLLLGDQQQYADNTIQKKGGILYPLLYADNNLIDQILDFRFSFANSNISNSAKKAIGAILNILGVKFDASNQYSFTLNEVLTTAVSKLDAVLARLGEFTNSSTAGTIGNLLSRMAKENKSVTDLLREFVDSYAVDNFYVNISGVLVDIINNFAIDSNKIGDGLNMDSTSDGLSKVTTFYTQLPKVVPTDEYLVRGITPSLLTLTFGKDPSTEMNLMWSTAKFRKSTIKITDRNGNTVSTVTFNSTTEAYGYPMYDLGLFAMFTNESYSDSIAEMTKKGFATTTKYRNVNKANITGLQPNTTYTYTITTENADKNGYYSNLNTEETIGTFTTAPAKNQASEFSFLGVTDIQGTLESSYKQAQNNLQSAINQSGNVDFIINAGDVTDNGKNIKQWHYAINNTDIFSKYPNVISAGNHESSGGILSRYFNIDNAEVNDKATDKGLYYSFTYANAKFIVLNTNSAFGKGLDEQQYKWLIGELQDNTAEWKIVVMHKGLYSAGSHTNDYEVEALRKQLTSVFYDYGVDIVLQGHDHTFTTTQFLDRVGKPIDNSNSIIKTANNTYNRPSGVLYITLGTIADKFYEFDADNTIPLDSKHSVVDTLTDPTYCYFTINGKSLTIDYHSFDNEIDKKLSSINILKQRTMNTSDTSVLSLVINDSLKGNIPVNLSKQDSPVKVSHDFSIDKLTVTRGKNSTWRLWDIQVEVVDTGKKVWNSVTPYTTFGGGIHNLKLVVTTEDGKTTNEYPFKIYVFNKLEDLIGEELKIMGKLYEYEMVFNMAVTDHLKFDFFDNPEFVLVEEPRFDETTDTMYYTFDYKGKRFYLNIDEYNLYPGEVWSRCCLSDDDGVIQIYKIIIFTPKAPNALLIVAIVFVVLIVVIAIINAIKKKKTGKGLFTFLNKFKKKDKSNITVN